MSAFEMAPPGTIYVCGACGKTHVHPFERVRADERPQSDGWDESCFLHRVLCYWPRVEGAPWQAVEGWDRYA